MVEDKNLTEKVCIGKVSNVSSHCNSDFLSNCDNARKVQHLIATVAAAEINSKERRPFQFGFQRDDNNDADTATTAAEKSQAVTVIGADQTNNHNTLNANSTIDSRACYKPEKKVIISHGKQPHTTPTKRMET